MSDNPYGVTQPGDGDYPLRTSEGAAGSIDEIRKRFSAAAPYEDPDFPATQESLGFVKGDSARGKVKRSANKYFWVRPHEIAEKAKRGKPNFAIAQGGDGDMFSSLDVGQGGLGNCWYVASVAALTSNKEQFKIIVPEDNVSGFEDNKYCGAFHFRFYNTVAGKYADVVVDDRLPVVDTGDGWYNYAFAKFFVDNKDAGIQSTEFWVALIEKAFAKYRGSYDAIEGGTTARGLELLTGGFSTYVDLDEFRKDPLGSKYDELEARVLRFVQCKQYLGVGTMSSVEKAAKEGAEAAYKNFGLRCKHAYSVLDGKQVRDKGTGQMRLLLKVRNPWGHTEWTGPFSDEDDASWAGLEQDLRSRDAKGSTAIDEGVFWIDLRDVIKYMKHLDYCAFGIGGSTKFASIRSEWPAELQEKKIDYCGGKERWLCPAFEFELQKGDSDLNLPPEYQDKCVVIMRMVVGQAGVGLDHIPQFMIYIFHIRKSDDVGGLDWKEKIGNSRQPKIYFGPNWDSDTLNKMDIFLPAGKYLLVPVLKTDEPDKLPTAYTGKAIPFSMSLYTECPTTIKQV